MTDDQSIGLRIDMRSAFHDLAQWRRLTSAQRTEVAVQLEPQLPKGMEFVGLETCAAAELAMYEHPTGKFMLIPGWNVELGFEVARFTPSAGQRESYESMLEEFTGMPPILDYMRQFMTPVRQVAIPPLLAAVRHELRRRELQADDPHFPRPDLWRGNGGFILCGDRTVHAEVTPTGQRIAYEEIGGSHRQLIEAFAADGFSVATSNEWEYLCGGGARTLFRWGDDCPCDDGPPGGGGSGESTWEVRFQPNAFGLHIADDAYHREVVVEPGIERGGDGGSLICGGMPAFLSWLMLAPAYEGPWDKAELANNADFDIRGWYTRRIVRLS
jgi:hypothetical protein